MYDEKQLDRVRPHGALCRVPSCVHEEPRGSSAPLGFRAGWLAGLALCICFQTGSLATAQIQGDGEKAQETGGESARCLACHGNRQRLEPLLEGKRDRVQAVILNVGILARSVHAANGCSDCHLEFEEYPHGKDAETAGCSDCHEESAEAYARSVHAQEGTENPRLPVSCSACHGVHDVFRATDRESTLHPLNVYRVCGKCHLSVDPETATRAQLMSDPYTDDAHAHGILQAGLVVSATCVSCHGGHQIRRGDDPESRVARHQVHKVCGQCHVRAVEDYSRSVHHLHNNGQDHKGATCSDCHASHDMKEADVDFRLQSIKACSNCHDERAGTFNRTYHGKVSSLGFGGRVATCEHCHDSHLILPASDLRSKVHPTRLVDTCGTCHENSHERFVAYLVHADPRDAAKYPRLNLVYTLMVGLLTTVIILGTVHVCMWLGRSLAAREWRHPRPGSGGGRYLRHHSVFTVWIEITTTVTTLLLAATGLPLYFSREPWADDLMRFVGGPSTAAFVHRAAAVVLMVAFVVFLGYVAHRWLVRRDKGLFRGPDSLVPSLEDLKEFWGNLRWFVGRGPKPRFDRWTYWEKFDFWAVFWGMAIMGASGLLLWFPEEATHFVPAWCVNAAAVVHGLEALLAIVFHFSVQAYQNHLRPDRFPLDASVFTGVLPEMELREERPREYGRLLAEGRLEFMVTREPALGAARLAYGFGIFCVAAGLLLLAAIIYTFLRQGMA